MPYVKGTPARVWSDEMKREVKRILDAGATMRDAEAATGVPRATIAGWYPGLKIRRPTVTTVQRQKGQRLTDTDKLRIFELVNYERMDYKQAAKVMNCSPSTIGDVLTKDGGDPVIVKYRRQREIEELDLRREVRIGILKKMPDLPVVNVDFGGRAVKSLTPDGPLVQVDTGGDRVKAMDIARLIREAKDEAVRDYIAAQPLVARITEKAG